MTFTSEKQSVLAKVDKSSKGSVDSHIRALCDIINSKPYYYTTSSCSGRTVIIKLSESGRKDEAKWLYTTHELANPEEIKPVDGAWFRFEPFILHIACRTVEHADRLIRMTRDLGLKRSGIISLGLKNTVEIIGSDHIAAPLTANTPDDYIGLLVKEANQKMQRNWDFIKKLEQELEKL